MTSESDESWMYDLILDSPADDNSNMRELRKGAWTSAEDAILVGYVAQNGEGNWNAVQKHTGLARCGKSCRLRWTNHLRPHLKKGPFSPEEEQRVVELHAKWGNKWAKMALELPGRTDNEIKNFWNTRFKRLQRAGLPIYPPGISVQDENQQSSSNMSTLSSQDTDNPDFGPFNNYIEIPPVEFKSLKLDDDNLYPTSAHLDPNNYLLARGPLPIQPATSFLASDYSFSSLNAVNDASIHMGPSPYGSIHMGQSQVYPSPYDHNFTTDHNASSVVFGSHAGLYGNTCSASEPDWAMQNELPSLQTQMGSTWGPHSSPLPFDTSIQNPPPTTHNTLSYNNRNSGLLDAVIGGSQTMQSPLSHASNVEVDTSQTSSRDFYNMERDPYSEQISPFSNSYSSVFSGSTPISRSSFDEHESLERGGNVQEQTTILDPNQMVFPRPDMLLGSNWAGTDYSKMYQNQDLRDSNR